MSDMTPGAPATATAAVPGTPGRPQARSFPRRRTDCASRLEDGVADGAAERDRRTAGHHRSRHGGALRRLHRQRSHRRQLADFPRRHRLHRLALHRHGRARRALRRGERARQGQPDRLSGVPDGPRPLARRPGPARLRPVADAAGSGERDARGQGRGVAVSPHDVRLQHRDAALLHAGRGASLGGRRPHAAPARHPHDGAERGVQRRADSRPGSHSGAWHTRGRRSAPCRRA